MRIVCIAMLALVVACQDPYVRVGKARLADADGTIAAPKGTTIEVPGGDVPASLSGTVRIAADSDVPYRDVMKVLLAVRNAGGDPVLLVAHARDVRALPPPVVYTEPTIGLEARADFKACVSIPDVKEKKCVKRPDGKHIDRAFVRELVREAVNATGLTRVDVQIADTISWVDAVRAIDGARTCCQGKQIDVSIDGAATRVKIQ
jgi:hypothetical protein